MWARENGTAPELCVIVLSYRDEETVLAAVDSLLAQEEPLEIVVSHSGGGPTESLLERHRPSLRVVSAPERRLPGAARNAGVAATSAPYVAFLAADCVAMPGWAAARLSRHRAGAAAVASALVPLDTSPASLASFLLQHNNRLEHLELPPHLMYGVSYTRAVLERHGPFLEALRNGEDGEFNTRLLLAGIEIEWAPEVVAGASHPSSSRDLFADQYRRGRLRAALSGGPVWRGINVGHSLMDAPAAAWRAARHGSPVSRGELARAAPLLAAGAVATAAGTARGGLSRDGEAVRELNRRRRIRYERARSAVLGVGGR